MDRINYKIPAWMGYVVAGVVILMVYAISELGWDFLVSPLLFLLGLAVAAFGVVTVIRRRTDHGDGGIVSLLQERSYIGFAAVAYGVSAILLGMILAAGAVLRQLNVWDQVWASLQANPGWLLGIVGIFLFLGSLIGLLGNPGPDRSTWQQISALPGKALAAIGILLALLLMAVGLLEIFYRPGFDAVLRILQNLLLASFDG